MSENLKKMISYYRPYRRVFFADMFFAMLASLIALVIPLIVRYVTSTVIYMEQEEMVRQVLYLGSLMVVLVGISCYCNYFISNYGHVMGAKIEYDMRAEIFAHFQKLSFAFYDNQKVGALMSRITTDLFDITELLHHGPENIVISLIKIIGALVIMLCISPRLTLAAFLLVPVMFVYALLFFKKMKGAFKRNRVKIAEINSQIEDNLSGIRVVKSFANEEIEEQKFQAGNQGFLKAKKNSYFYMGGYHAGLGSFSMLITVVVLVAGALGISRGSVGVTDLITFLLYINILTEPIKTLIDFTEQFQNGYTGFERFREIMAIKPDIENDKDAVALEEVKGVIDFNHVSFQYEDNTETVLSNINFHVDAGEYVALVGSSGAGKSTLCSLIPRFYDTTSGKILVDGQDIRCVTLESLRTNIGVVQQDVYLFSGTVFENIAYGRPGASKEEVIEAAKMAGAHEFISQLKAGYDTYVGERGVKLSGGQKQRISIARVFLKNPAILILDEATSALDNESEHLVNLSLERLAQGRTTMTIAHRLSTIQGADRILVLSGSQIVEEGSHSQLLEKKGMYYELYKMANAKES